MPTIRRTALWLTVTALAATMLPSASASTRTAAAETRPVLFVGNNWEGTADVVASTADLT